MVKPRINFRARLKSSKALHQLKYFVDRTDIDFEFRLDLPVLMPRGLSARLRCSAYLGDATSARVIRERDATASSTTTTFRTAYVLTTSTSVPPLNISTALLAAVWSLVQTASQGKVQPRYSL